MSNLHKLVTSENIKKKDEKYYDYYCKKCDAYILTHICKFLVDDSIKKNECKFCPVCNGVIEICDSVWDNTN